MCKAHYQRWWRTGAAESDGTVTYTRVRNGKEQTVTRRLRSTEKSYSRTVLYRVWRGMMTRCYNPKAQNYRWYGGKGIEVCEPWHDFLVFRTWAEMHGWRQGLEVDRKDSTKGYTPRNCQLLPKRENIKRARHSNSVRLPDEIMEWLSLEAPRRGTTVEALASEILTKARESTPTVRRRKGGDAECQ